ncbi:hypothetical protein [Lactobacillus phage Sabazios]|nr:hypothetical protein [Lactobacillus phage Sabazios]
MSTINGRACVANGNPVDKVFSNGKQVYGRNLLTGTSVGLKTKQLTNWYNVGQQATNGNFKIKVVNGQKYTYRAWLDNTNGPANAFVDVRFLPTADGAKDFDIANGVPIKKGETGYSTSVFTPLEDGYIKLTPFSYAAPVTALAGWKEEKLEKFNVATPWTPAPEDVM